MKRFWQASRTIAIIAGITLALDFAITLLVPNRYLDPWVRLRERDDLIYDRTVPWHHEIKPNVQLTRGWGHVFYPYTTDSEGFRTGRCAARDAAAEKDRTVFVIGDSFAEGIGVSFEESFVGLLACAYRERGFAVRNLGTASYSPVIYWRKIAATAQRLGLTPREIVVFLDISDAHNDAVDYVDMGDRVTIRPLRLETRIKLFLDRNSMLFVVAKGLYFAIFGHPNPQAGNQMALWTVEPALMEEWGRRGLERNTAYLEKIVGQCAGWRCRLTLVVYPWPDQIWRNDRDGVQVRHWRDWSARHGVRFVDAFAPFFTVPAAEAVERYFIRGDVHFNAAGGKLVFDKVWSEIDPAR